MTVQNGLLILGNLSNFHNTDGNNEIKRKKPKHAFKMFFKPFPCLMHKIKLLG